MRVAWRREDGWPEKSSRGGASLAPLVLRSRSLILTHVLILRGVNTHTHMQDLPFVCRQHETTAFVGVSVFITVSWMLVSFYLCILSLRRSSSLRPCILH